EDDHEPVVGRPHAERPTVAAVDLAAVDGYPGPVRVAGDGAGRALTVPPGVDGTGDERVLAVGADDDVRGLDEARATLRRSPDPPHPSVHSGQFGHDDVLP